MTFDLGLARLREEFGLAPVEYPATRAAEASPADRAKDIHAAFTDPDIKAVIAAVGGEDELKVLPHLNPDVLAGNRKPYLGYSDNTNLHPAATVTGPAFGGSLEILDVHLRTGRYLLPDDSYDGAVLFLETSEELPPASYVYRVLMCMGERGLLQRFAAIIWARPKAWSFDQPNGAAGKARYTADQRDAVLATAAEYHPGAPLVFGVDFGHTDPQHVIPSGGEVTVDSQNRQIMVAY